MSEPVKDSIAGQIAGRITGSELEVMKLLWRAEDALPITEIRETLQRQKGWEPATIKTLVSRLVGKGALRRPWFPAWSARVPCARKSETSIITRP